VKRVILMLILVITRHNTCNHGVVKIEIVVKILFMSFNIYVDYKNVIRPLQ